MTPRHFPFFFLLTFLLGCNVYSPFVGSGSDEDRVEAARKCLHEGDYQCAITFYSEIESEELRNRKLCEVYLSQGGMTLNVLINTIISSNSNMLGELAQSLVPWTQEKSDSFDQAKTYCTAFEQVATTTVSLNSAVLLKSISLFTHCAIRIAKTDKYVATSNADTACNTAGNSSGTITTDDITTNSDGSITSTGMCATDVTACGVDISGIDGDALSNAGLSGVQGALNSVPDALKSTSSGTDATRGAIRDSL